MKANRVRLLRSDLLTEEITNKLNNQVTNHLSNSTEHSTLEFKILQQVNNFPTFYENR
jgi:hypothetical protein